MRNNNYNLPLEFTNKKPKGIPFYMYPAEVIKYACKNLTGRELKLYLAISGQAWKDNLNKPYHWTLKHFCEVANIKTNHYQEILQELCKKGFIIHEKFEAIKVLYPIGENEYLAENGDIKTKQEIFKENNSEITIENEPNSSNGKSANNSMQDLILLKKEESNIKNGNNISNFGNNFSQSKANNKEINNSINNKNNYKEVSNSHKWEFENPTQKAVEPKPTSNFAEYL